MVLHEGINEVIDYFQLVAKLFEDLIVLKRVKMFSEFALFVFSLLVYYSH